LAVTDWRLRRWRLWFLAVMTAAHWIDPICSGMINPFQIREFEEEKKIQILGEILLTHRKKCSFNGVKSIVVVVLRSGEGTRTKHIKLLFNLHAKKLLCHSNKYL